MSRKQEPPSALTVGMEWGTRVTTIGMEFAVPALLGYGLDRWLHASPWFTVIGAFLGLGIGMVHVLRLPQELSGPVRERRSSAPPPPGALPGPEVPLQNQGEAGVPSSERSQSD